MESILTVPSILLKKLFFSCDLMISIIFFLCVVFFCSAGWEVRNCLSLCILKFISMPSLRDSLLNLEEGFDIHVLFVAEHSSVSDSVPFDQL